MSNLSLGNISTETSGRRGVGVNSVSIRALAAGGLALFLYYAIAAPSFAGFAGAVLVTSTALLPIFLWLLGYVRGIPCFLLFSVLHILYYATPLVILHPLVEEYSGEEKLVAAATVSIYLLLATFTWAFISRSHGRPLARVLAFDAHGHIRHYLFLLGASALFTFNSVAGLIDIPQDLASLMRPFVSGLALISVFLLAYNLGRGDLTSWQGRTFLVLLSLLTVANCLSLFLITSFTCLASALAGYWLSARRLPIFGVVVICLFLTILQAGKYEMRETYLDEGYLTVRPLQYPAYLAEWTFAGFRRLLGVGAAGSGGGASAEIGLLERASLVQMLLKVETETPSPVPYLGGDTYVDIPELMLPRFLFPEKATSHAAMQRLSAHFGLLTFDIAERTSIAWGLLPEAYANFGVFGAVLMAFVVGTFFGLLARSSWGYSVFSVRSIVSIMVMVCIFGMESHAAAAVTTIFQSLVAVVVASALFARKRPNSGSEF